MGKSERDFLLWIVLPPNQCLKFSSADLKAFVFCGPESKVGRGVLVITRAQILPICEIRINTKDCWRELRLENVKDSSWSDFITRIRNW